MFVCGFIRDRVEGGIEGVKETWDSSGHVITEERVVMQIKR